MHKAHFSVVSLFSGAGGSSTGYKMAGGEILAANEFVKIAAETYGLNYPETVIFTDDIRQLSGKAILDNAGLEVGELDILDGSPPCASFSVQGRVDKLWGVSKKYSDTKQRTDDLFFEFIRLVGEIQPKVFVAENVKGLTVGKSRVIFNKILREMENSGYNVTFKVLNSADFGVPQKRERVFIVGTRKDQPQFSFDNLETVKRVSLMDGIKDLEFISFTRAFGEVSNRIVKKSDQCYTVLEDGMGPTRRFRCYRSWFTPSMIPPKDRQNFFSHLNMSGDYDSSTISLYNKGKNLSIDELKFICGFPQDFKLVGSYRKMWERLGRAVPPLMMKQLAHHINETVLKKEHLK